MVLQRASVIMSMWLVYLMQSSRTLAFAPIQSQSASRRHIQQPSFASVDPSDIVSAVHQISDRPTWDAFLSTLYSSAVKLVPAHGHSMPLFGPPDPYLLKMQSIAPLPDAFDKTGLDVPTLIDEASIPDRIRGAFDYARKGTFVDPTKIIQIDDGASPGFVKTGTFFPELKAVPTSQEYQLGVLDAEVGKMKVLQKLPIAAFITVLIDFFLVTPGVEVYKEEIEEGGGEIAKESVVAGGFRVAVLALVAGLTLVFSG